MLPRVLVVLVLVFAVLGEALGWRPLDKDGVHDPRSPAIGILQPPAEALSELPPDVVGNRVNWIEALRRGYINPRTRLHPDTRIEVIDTVVYFRDTAGMPQVMFPHRPHTEWLGCGNCHDALFERVAGTTEFGMEAVLKGEKCGVCHGAVAFPLTECDRCHSVPLKGPAN